MSLLSDIDVKFIIEQCGLPNKNLLSWSIDDYSNKIVGYLGEHLRLIANIESGQKSQLKFFIKCIPRFDKWKANYLREASFFNKEYIMLNELFNKFQTLEGLRSWRPKLFLVKEELFVFEDVTQLEYTMPSNVSTLDYDEIMATAAALARFHAQSYIHEEHESTSLNRPYRIWEHYYQYLSEPPNTMAWRDTGMRAVIDFLKVYSQFQSKLNFQELIEEKIPELFNRAYDLMKPSLKYRNVVVHRDVWSNNIFLRRFDNDSIHALIVDYQTVLYCAPTVDLTSMIYFNTTKHFRDQNIPKLIDYYYDVLSDELKLGDVDIKSIILKSEFEESFKECLVFGMTQAALIVPLIAMPDENREKLFNKPEQCAKLYDVSRSHELVTLAQINDNYRKRVIELLDDIVETFIYPQLNIT